MKWIILFVILAAIMVTGIAVISDRISDNTKILSPYGITSSDSVTGGRYISK